MVEIFKKIPLGRTEATKEIGIDILAKSDQE